MSNSKKNEKKNAVLNTLKFYLPVAWKLSKRYFIVSVINVIVQAVLPFTIFVMKAPNGILTLKTWKRR